MVSTSRTGQQGFSEINVTPLTDVLLVLLIIFLATSSTLTSASQRIELPEVVTRSELEEDRYLVELDAEGQLTFEGRRLTLEQLVAELKRLRHPQEGLVLAADRKVPFGTVRPLLRELQQLEIAPISLGTVHRGEP